MSTMIEAAKAYATRGWHVIPLHSTRLMGGTVQTCTCTKGHQCNSKGKHPIALKWTETAKPEVDGIERAFVNPFTAEPNIGLGTGSASGFWVLDIDPEHGGFETMTAMMAGRDPLPATYRVRTGSGGLHFYWAMPEGVEIRNRNKELKQFGPGLDVRGTGGQVVAPPSVSDKGSYEVMVDVPVAPAPDWLVELVREKDDADSMVAEGAAQQATRAPGEPVEPRLARYTANAVKGLTDRLDAMVRASTPDGRDYRGEPWNQTCFAVACNLWELANAPWNDLTPGDALMAFVEHAPKDASFNKPELRTIWRSAQTTVGTNFRVEPPPKEKPLDLLEGVEDRTPVRLSDAAVPPFPEGPAATSPSTGPISTGDEAPSPTPDKPAEPDTPSEVDPFESAVSDIDHPHHSIFFDKKDLLITRLADWVLRGDPIGYGIDKNFWTYEGGVWKPNPLVVQDRCVELLGDTYRNGHFQNATPRVRLLARKINIEPHQDWMNFTNGMLNWQSGELVEHSPDFESTVQFPLDWEPSAECPLFDDWLLQILHPDYATLCWEMLGYLMLSGNPQQVAFMLYGEGGNGKGTLIRVIQSLLGKHNCAAETLQRLNSDRFSPINLFGKIANIAGDIDGTYLESTATFKALTGEDTFGGEAKYGARFVFESWAVPVFSANKIPGSADVTEGYLRRWVILNFAKKFREDEKILKLSDKLAREKAGIAVKAVDALRTMMQHGKFTIVGEALRGKEEFARSIDQVRQWIQQALIEAPDHFESGDDLYDDYRYWQEKNNVGKLAKIEFLHRLGGIGLRSGMEHDVRGFYGLRVRPKGPQPATGYGLDSVFEEGASGGTEE